ncbi:MAG TPA: DUF3592 domain-containing protein [Telluria sp.]|nr:DUF3592 domain-containing protein [Telluria sp.]
MTETRALSGSVKRAIFFSAPLAWIGLIFTLFGAAMLAVFGSASDLTSSFVFSDHNPRAQGRLIAKVASSASSNRRRIYEYVYRYEVNAIAFTGTSFDIDNGALPGSPVTVQHLAHDPATSRLEGMKKAPFGLHVALLVSIFPLVGLVMLYFGARRYRTYRYLVEHGVLTTGKVVRKEPTSTKINEQTVYDVFFQYRSSDGVLREACVSTHKSDNLGDEAQEPLVYDAARPDQAVLLDAMPPAIRRLVTGR